MDPKSAGMSGAAQPRCYAIDDLASYAASERTTQAAPQNADPNGMGSSNGYHQAAVPPQIQPTSPQSANAAENNTPQKEKRHRNKPSLSCEVCTVKKTKCDRVRPECFACQKRKTPCHYSPLADMIEESHRAQGHETPRKRPRTTKKGDENSVVFSPDAATPIRVADLANAKRINASMPLGPAAAAAASSPIMYNQERPASRPTDRTPSRSSTGSSPTLLSNIPFSHPTASNLFKVEHPFTNYWTHQGGLAEVIHVLPSKEQSDILIATYFDVVDPVYPLIHRESFEKEYEDFWIMQPTDSNHRDGSLVALVFVMLAMGTQFVAIPSPDQKEQTAEFYISAAHQALRVINYLGRPSIRTMQTMVLMIYFLMNDNHASDAWAFAGILTRHASALGINRNPAALKPQANAFEKQQRLKLWQAVLFQDTFFTIILKLPPTTMHSDCHVEDLVTEVDPRSLTLYDGATDVTYIVSMWKLANIVQPNICIPRSLDLPICDSQASRDRLVGEFQSLYASLPSPFRTFEEQAVWGLASRNRRLARQMLFLTSNYYHCLMLVYADEQVVESDVHGTLDSAHEAISSFFLLHKLFPEEARVWYHFQHRAFSEALVIAELVKNRGNEMGMVPKMMRAKDDVLRMIGILGVMSDHDMVARTRVSVLSKYI